MSDDEPLDSRDRAGQHPAARRAAGAVGDREIAIFNLGDRFLATDNRCPHKGGPLCDGIVTGTSVVCPLHAWKVNLSDGASSVPRARRNVASRPIRFASTKDIVVVAVPCAAVEATGRMKGFLRAGHTPTLVAALLYFDVSFMAWVLLGPLAPFLRDPNWGSPRRSRASSPPFRCSAVRSSARCSACSANALAASAPACSG